VLVIGLFTLSPFKLPHYGLPAFPALALVVARLWDEALEQEDGAPRIRTLLGPVLVVLAAVAVAAALAWANVLPGFGRLLASVDVTTRNFEARGQVVPGEGLDVFRPLLASIAVILGAGAVAMGVALRRRRPEMALAVALGAVLAFLPVAGSGMAEFARSRSAAPIAEALLFRLRPPDIVAHEGAIENTASLLLAVRRPVHLVDGMVSNLAFGATFPDAADLFWDRARLAEAWGGPRRVFLVTAASAERSVVRSLPPDRVHVLAESRGRRLYSNLAD
jgi:hypothetical protein